MIVNVNIINEASNCMILFRLIAIKTEAGLYELDFQTSIANISMNAKSFEAVLIILLNVLLLTMALYIIHQDFEKGKEDA